MRSDAQARHSALIELIEEMAAALPRELDGDIWAGPLSQAEWIDRSGLTPRTFQRLIKQPPIVSTVRGIGARKGTYLRLGAVEAVDRRKVQNTMAKIWREHSEQTWLNPASGEFGCICGMAEAWPCGWQIKIFDHALKHWGDFMAYTKLEIQAALDVMERASANGYEPDLYCPGALVDHVPETARRVPADRLEIRHLEFPSLTYLRVFQHVAQVLFVDHLQDHGRPVPMELH